MDTANGLITAAQGAWLQASALAVTYAFSVAGALILLIAGYILAGTAQQWAYAGLKQVRGFDETLARFFSRVLRYVILAFVAVTALAQFGVQTASVLAALGAAGLAVGLALQGTLQNIAAGVMLLVLKPFRSGEYIEAGTVQGTVEEIGLFATELKTTDGIYVLAPNSTLWNTPVRNFTRNPLRRLSLTVKLEQAANPGRARDILLETLRDAPEVSNQPQPRVLVSERTGVSSTLTTQFWSHSAQYEQIGSDLGDRVQLALSAEGIAVASVT